MNVSSKLRLLTFFSIIVAILVIFLLYGHFGKHHFAYQERKVSSSISNRIVQLQVIITDFINSPQNERARSQLYKTYDKLFISITQLRIIQGDSDKIKSIIRHFNEIKIDFGKLAKFATKKHIDEYERVKISRAKLFLFLRTSELSFELNRLSNAFENEQEKSLQDNLYIVSVIVFTFIILISIITFVLNREVIISINSLTTGIKEFGLGRLDYKFKLKNKDEFRMLADNIKKMAMDLVESTKEKKALEVSKRSAEEANIAKSSFLSHMSHEIRTPLNTILGVSQLLLDDEKVNNVQKDYIDILKRAGKALLATINDILDLSKIEANQLDLEFRNFNIKKLLNDIVIMFRAQAAEKRIDLSLEMDCDLEFIYGDSNRIQQILINLIGNAIKFTKIGKIVLRIHRVDSDLIELSVSDTGIGISNEMINEIFSPFCQGDVGTSRKHGGTGLGLAISKQLIEMMGGDIRVKSSEYGSTFLFTIPYNNPDKLSDVIESNENDKMSKIDSRELKILLVDDSDDNIAIVISLLSKTNYIIDVAKNGASAVVKFKEKKYDLVLMDIQMPVMDGLVATAMIREWETEKNLSRTSIIALTAHVLKHDREKSKIAGCDYHFAKPIDRDRLMEVIVEFTS